MSISLLKSLIFNLYKLDMKEILSLYIILYIKHINSTHMVLRPSPKEENATISIVFELLLLFSLRTLGIPQN